ncbi:MAG TPA: 1-phosphofructokinase family hexose kinase [bacterium]|nr:1-phosphofructokinase family hexose kinase [bacterium]
MIDTLTLNPSIDQHITVAKLVKDDTLRALSVRQDPGGKGINVARGLHVLGRSTRAFTFLGGNTGLLFKKLLEREKVEFISLPVPGETRINNIITDLSDGTQTRISLPGPPVDPAALDRMAETLKTTLPRPTYWVLGGSLPEGVPTDIYRVLIGRLQARGEHCVLDADGEELKEGLFAMPFLIKPNEYELARLAGRPLAGEKEIQKAALELCDQGVRIVAVSLGAQGALLATLKDCYFLRAPAVEAKSKVGAGDSFIAGFLSEYADKGDLLAAGISGVAAGSAAVAKEGTQLYSREDYDRLKPLVQWRRLP